MLSVKSNIMKKNILIIWTVFLIGINLGSYLTHREYVKRSLEIPEKDVFTNQDIEHILYNTPTDR